MTQAVMDYLADRRQKWLDKQIKADTDEATRLAFETEGNIKFSLKEWLPDAAKRAVRLSIVSHPSKFSHPSVKTSAVIAQAKASADGYIRSGNVNYPLDVAGDAAVMDVYKFLALVLSDGQTVLEHLEQQTSQAKFILHGFEDGTDEEMRQKFLAIKSSNKKITTSGLIKQIYFPVAQNYHLLSVLTPSGMITELKQRIDSRRFSEESKAAREARKNQKIHEQGFNDILNLTVMGYGGSKPQNISVLNNQNSGRAYLLPSIPPKLEFRKIRIPTQDFFSQTLRQRDFDEQFQALLRLMDLGINNIHVRAGIKKLLHAIIDAVLYQAFCLRMQEGGWSERGDLKKPQRVWLDAALSQQRDSNADWQEKIANAMQKWMTKNIEKKQPKIMFGPAEMQELHTMVIEALAQDKEYF